jgi:hypothetical protein
MRRYPAVTLAAVVVALLVLALTRSPLVPRAQAQHLSKFQNVEFAFNTTGAASTLAFFDRDSGDLYLYVAGQGSDFQFVRRLTVVELGAPLTVAARTRLPAIPQLPQAVDVDDVR